MVDFKKLSDPEYIKQMEIDRKERERIYQEKEALREKTVCFTGHRPDKLGGYDMKNPTMLKLKDKLLEVIEELITKDNKTRFISGGALGTDIAAFWCVHMLKKKYPVIENIVAIPFKNQDKIWPDEQKYWYQRMLESADEIVNVEEVDKYKTDDDNPGEFSLAKMQKRNEYMVDHSQAIVAVYDGRKGGTANCLYYARRCYLGHQIWRMHPKYDFELEISYTAG